MILRLPLSFPILSASDTFSKMKSQITNKEIQRTIGIIELISNRSCGYLQHAVCMDTTSNATTVYRTILGHMNPVTVT